MSSVDFQPTEDQRDLRAGVRELLAGRFGREALRAAVDAAADRGVTVDRELWRELGEAGFFALRLPEGEGGVGLGLPEAVLVFEEAGRALLPGPLVATHLAAGVVPGAAAGTTVVTALDLGDHGGGPLVAYLGESDAVLGAPVLRSGVPGVSAVPGVPGAVRVRSADPLTPLYRVAPPVDAGAAAAATSEYREEGALLTAALQLGSALRTVELAVGYAKEREQFGQPIGAFQAVKHLCAQMLVRAEVARTAVYAAAVTAYTGGPAEIAAAKLLADAAAVRNARDCLQVHGGMGFTWEADVHLHLKRAWVRAEQWRTAAEAEELLAAALLEEALPAGAVPAEALPAGMLPEGAQ